MNKKTVLTIAIMAILVLTGLSCTSDKPTPVPEAVPLAPTETLPPLPAGQDEPATEQPIIEPTTQEPVEPTVKPLPETSVSANCDDLGPSLSACAPYKCQFVHPFTGTNMIREVVGLVNGECQYAEQMPNDGKMECNYSLEERKTAGQFYLDNITAYKTGASMEGKTYTVAGQQVENPLEVFNANGTCVIFGY